MDWSVEKSINLKSHDAEVISRERQHVKPLSPSTYRNQLTSFANHAVEEKTPRG